VTLVAVRATPGLWLDSDFTWTPARLDVLDKWSHSAYGRPVGLIGYAPLPGEPVDSTLWTPTSLADVCQRGYQALWIQHPLNPGWLPTEHLGALHEATASAYAASCGFPAEMHGGLDVEGTGGGSYGYALTWSANRKQRGGSTLGYNGYDLGMLLSQWEALPDVDAYWSGQRCPDVGGRGPCMRQQYPSLIIPGVGSVDLNLMKADARGSLPLVCALSPDVA
jgi:hypothetical protein